MSSILGNSSSSSSNSSKGRGLSPVVEVVLQGAKLENPADSEMCEIHLVLLLASLFIYLVYDGTRKEEKRLAD